MVTRLDLQSRSLPCGNLKHHQTLWPGIIRKVSGKRRFIKGPRIRVDMTDDTGLVDKDQIETDKSIAHPERYWLRLLIDKEHPASLGQPAPEHQSLRTCLGGISDLDMNRKRLHGAGLKYLDTVRRAFS